MTNTLRVVVDTNVLVSGLLGIEGSPSFKILKAVRTQKIILVSSAIILKEIKNVINRERIVKLTKMSPRERLDFISLLLQRSHITPGKQLNRIVGRDAKDDKFLACALEGQVDYVITGDKDLLVFKKFEGVKIVTPKKFITLEAFEKS